MKVELKPYNDVYKEQIIIVWENSVRYTHHFLLSSDIEYYKKIVKDIDFNSLQVYCLTFPDDKVIGFIGIADKKIEMLFLDPNYIGKGYGKTLVDFAINQLGANKVDVNEQNQSAVGFYSKMGFITFDKTEKDNEGKDYPILKMKLKQ